VNVYGSLLYDTVVLGVHDGGVRAERKIHGLVPSRKLRGIHNFILTEQRGKLRLPKTTGIVASRDIILRSSVLLKSRCLCRI
jgi:hypothetical protein